MSTIETLLQEARLFPQIEQLKLAALLIQRAQSVVPTAEQRRAAIRRRRGKFKQLLPTVDEYMAVKRAELEQEERKFGARARGARRSRLSNPFAFATSATPDGKTAVCSVVCI